MRLPQYNQQITQPPKEVTQPIEQTFGIETAQAKQQFASGLQQATSNVVARLQEMETNNQQLKANQIMIDYSMADSQKRNEILARTGTKAENATKEYTQWQQEKRKEFEAKAPPLFKQHVLDSIDQHYIQGLDQVSTHEVAQQRAVTIDSYTARIGLAQDNVLENNSDPNLLFQSKIGAQSIRDLGAYKGEDKGLTELKVKDFYHTLITTSVQSLINSNDLDAASARVENNPELLGGKRSQTYIELETKVSDLKFTRDVSNQAQTLVADYHGQQNGFEAGLKEIESKYADLSPQKRAQQIGSLELEYRKFWNIQDLAVNARNDEYLNRVETAMQDIKHKLAQNVNSPKFGEMVLQANNELTKIIEQTAPNKKAMTIAKKRVNNEFWPTKTDKDSGLSGLVEYLKKDRLNEQAIRIKVRDEQRLLNRILINNPNSFGSTNQIYADPRFSYLREFNPDGIQGAASMAGITNTQKLGVKAFNPNAENMKLIDKADLDIEQTASLYKMHNDWKRQYTEKHHMQPNAIEENKNIKQLLTEVKIGEKPTWFGLAKKDVKIPSFMAKPRTDGTILIRNPDGSVSVEDGK